VSARDTALKPFKTILAAASPERPTANKTTVIRRRKAFGCACGWKADCVYGTRIGDSHGQQL